MSPKEIMEVFEDELESKIVTLKTIDTIKKEKSNLNRAFKDMSSYYISMKIPKEDLYPYFKVMENIIKKLNLVTLDLEKIETVYETKEGLEKLKALVLDYLNQSRKMTMDKLNISNDEAHEFQIKNNNVYKRFLEIQRTFLSFELWHNTLEDEYNEYKESLNKIEKIKQQENYSDVDIEYIRQELLKKHKETILKVEGI